MHVKMEVYTPEEFEAMSKFCLDMAEVRRLRDKLPESAIGGIDQTPGFWARHSLTPEGGTSVIGGNGPAVAPAAEPVAEPEPAKRKPGRPRREPVAETTPLTEEPVSSGQLDIEDVIAATNGVTQDNVVTEPEVPQPADPAAGWTTQDARAAGGTLLNRAPNPEVGNKTLFALLSDFGVQQVRALKEDQIEAFVVATQKAVF